MTHELLPRAESVRGDLINFLRDIVAIPSLSGQERQVVERVRQEMTAVGFDEVKIDPLGNILGRVGDGPRLLAFDAHLDTVDVTDREQWSLDPFLGKLEAGRLYGRGAVDQKAGMAAMVYAAKLLKETGVPTDCQVWMVGSVMEEDCDGLCWHYILQEGILRPELVVSTEPTSLRITRGQRGRMEMRVAVTGRSCHGSMPELGDNAVYKIVPGVLAVRDLNERLADDEFLGKGSCTVTWIESRGPSLCAVPDHAEFHIDRRLTTGETEASAIAEVKEALATVGVEATVRTLEYRVPSWTELVYPMAKYYPTWVLPEDHVAVQAASRAFSGLFDTAPEISRWNFSTNGVAIKGLHDVPCIGFGPGDETLAHARDEFVPVEEVVRACAMYAALPEYYLAATAD
ncbi:MAG: YgeY family selenium metabolism-linked hydrolase [bacterium]